MPWIPWRDRCSPKHFQATRDIGCESRWRGELRKSADEGRRTVVAFPSLTLHPAAQLLLAVTVRQSEHPMRERHDGFGRAQAVNEQRCNEPTIGRSGRRLLHCPMMTLWSTLPRTQDLSGGEGSLPVPRWSARCMRGRSTSRPEPWSGPKG